MAQHVLQCRLPVRRHNPIGTRDFHVLQLRQIIPHRIVQHQFAFVGQHQRNHRHHLIDQRPQVQ
jgi:hypothetical protein